MDGYQGREKDVILLSTVRANSTQEVREGPKPRGAGQGAACVTALRKLQLLGTV